MFRVAFAIGIARAWSGSGGQSFSDRVVGGAPNDNRTGVIDRGNHAAGNTLIGGGRKAEPIKRFRLILFCIL